MSIDFDDPALSDASLMSWLAVGEDDALAPLIRRYQRPLMALLARGSGDRHEAEDLFQEIWMRVMRGARGYDPTLPFRPWLFTVAWNALRNAMRRQRDEHHVPLETAGAVAAWGDAHAAAEARQRDAMLRVVVEALPSRLAETVFLRYFEELSEREVAARTGVPVGTVKSRLHHALRRLAAALEEES